MKIINLLIFLSVTLSSITQVNVNQLKRVLFLGNSYTSVNNLPELIRVLALSASDTLQYDSNTPGGQTLEGHFSNTTTTDKIAQGNWDYVVLQEQSQRPSFSDSQVEVEVFPFANKLDSLVQLANPCTETMFYMTWGRKNGDAANCGFFPPICTYQGMDSMLYLRYMQMADENHAVVSPVGALWHYLRDTHPEIELYSSDESHPSLAGSYAAACSFYSTIFRESPMLISENSSLDATQALIIREAAKLIVFDSLSKWFVGNYDPIASFTYSIGADGRTVTFTNTSMNANVYYWSFGDFNNSTDENPTNQFVSDGNYAVELVSSACGMNALEVQTIVIEHVGLEEEQIKSESEVVSVFPNPSVEMIHVDSKNIIDRISLYSFTGDEIQTIDIQSTNTKIDISKLESGLYFYTVIFKNGDRRFGNLVKN